MRSKTMPFSVLANCQSNDKTINSLDNTKEVLCSEGYTNHKPIVDT